MNLTEELSKIGEVLVVERAFEGGCFFVSMRQDPVAPFKICGFCNEKGIYPEFLAATDIQAAHNFIFSLR